MPFIIQIRCKSGCVANERIAAEHNSRSARAGWTSKRCNWWKSGIEKFYKKSKYQIGQKGCQQIRIIGMCHWPKMCEQDEQRKSLKEVSTSQVIWCACFDQLFQQTVHVFIKWRIAKYTIILGIWVAIYYRVKNSCADCLHLGCTWSERWRNAGTPKMRFIRAAKSWV